MDSFLHTPEVQITEPIDTKKQEKFLGFLEQVFKSKSEKNEKYKKKTFQSIGRFCMYLISSIFDKIRGKRRNKYETYLVVRCMFIY